MTATKNNKTLEKMVCGGGHYLEGAHFFLGCGDLLLLLPGIDVYDKSFSKNLENARQVLQ